MAYLQLIASRGLIVYDPVGAVNQGMVACSLEDQMTGEETVDQLMRLYPNLTWDQANVIGLSAAQVLCPRNYHPERGATTPRKNRAI